MDKGDTTTHLFVSEKVRKQYISAKSKGSDRSGELNKSNANCRSREYQLPYNLGFNFASVELQLRVFRKSDSPVTLLFPTAQLGELRL
jgi:hypothetical protein